MKLPVLVPLLIGVSGIVSWSIVFKYRKAWGQQLGPYAICARLLKEDRAWGWLFILSQLFGVAVGAYALYLINVR